MAGAPKGNKNGARGKVVRDALDKILKRHPDHFDSFEPMTGIEKLAYVMVKEAYAGDIKSMREVADRLEGKPTAIVEANINETHMSHEEWLANLVEPDD